MDPVTAHVALYFQCVYDGDGYRATDGVGAFGRSVLGLTPEQRGEFEDRVLRAEQYLEATRSHEGA
jgi:hypothetical protein